MACTQWVWLTRTARVSHRFAVRAEGSRAASQSTVAYVVIPVIFLAGAAAVIWNFPITRERQQALREQIEAESD